jgi:hypothetical protein
MATTWSAGFAPPNFIWTLQHPPCMSVGAITELIHCTRRGETNQVNYLASLCSSFKWSMVTKCSCCQIHHWGRTTRSDVEQTNWTRWPLRHGLWVRGPLSPRTPYNAGDVGREKSVHSLVICNLYEPADLYFVPQPTVLWHPWTAASGVPNQVLAQRNSDQTIRRRPLQIIGPRIFMLLIYNRMDRHKAFGSFIKLLVTYSRLFPFLTLRDHRRSCCPEICYPPEECVMEARNIGAKSRTRSKIRQWMRRGE